MRVQVWDGRKFETVTRDAAREMVEAGGHEISTGKNANHLLTYSRLQARKKDAAAAKRKAAAEYKTREMRAATKEGKPDEPVRPAAKPKATRRSTKR